MENGKAGNEAGGLSWIVVEATDGMTHFCKSTGETTFSITMRAVYRIPIFANKKQQERQRENG